MKNQNAKTITTRSFLIAATAVGMLLLSFSTQSFGQKEPFEARRATSRDGLIDTGYMTKAYVSDGLDGNDEEYFYKFQAVAGKLTVILVVVANETNAGATLDLFGTNSRAILSDLLVQAINGGSERVSKSVNLAKPQEIIIRINGLKYGTSGGYPGIYKIRLEGTAVNFKDAAPPDGPVEVKKPDAAPSDGPVEVKKPDAAPTLGPVEGKKPDVVDRAIEKGKTKSQKLLRVLDKVKTKIPN